MTDPTQKTFVNLSSARGASGSREDELYLAVQATVASDYELLGELGRGDRGKVVYLARELASGSLVALRLDRGSEPDAEYELTVLPHLDESVPSPDSACPYCGRHVRGWARFCPNCGRDISGEGESDSESGFTTQELLAAVRDSAADEYAVLGEMPRARGGGRVYFARDLATGAIVALRLQRERSESGPDQFSLGRTQVLTPLVADMGAQYASPTGIAPPVQTPPSATPRGSPTPPPRAGADRRSASAPAQPAPFVAIPPTPQPPEGRTVVGFPGVLPGAGPVAPGADQAVSEDAIVDTAAAGARRRRLAIVGGGATLALLGALALTLAGGGNELANFDTARADSARVDSTSSANKPPVDSTASKPPVDTTAVKRPERVLLVVTGELPAGATILVDGRQIRGREVRVTPGPHTVSVRASGFEPFTQRVQTSGDTTRLSPRLRRHVTQSAESVARTSVDSSPKPPAPTCARSFAGQEWSSARTLCRTEASAGDPAAQRNLGVLLLRGLGGPADEAGAVNWLRLAANSEDVQALFELGRVYQTRKAYRDDRRAYDNFRRAALRGHAEAQLQAGRALEHGIGTAQNLHEALLMFEQSAKSGYAPGQNAYGVFLKKGLGVPRDDRKALEWLTKAAQGGSPDAHFHIGELHEQGRAGLPKSRAAAMEWYRKGAALGSEEARRALRR